MERREGGKEGWKLDEHGQCSHHQISLTLFLISLFTLPLHICIPRVQKLILCIFVYLCIILMCVCGLSRHTLPAWLLFPLSNLACADEAVGRGLLMKESQRGLFVNMQMRGMCKWEGA